MTPDPIVEEVHRVREEILKRFGGDLRAYVQDAARRQGEDGRTVVRRSPRRPAETAEPAPEPEKRVG